MIEPRLKPTCQCAAPTGSPRSKSQVPVRAARRAAKEKDDAEHAERTRLVGRVPWLARSACGRHPAWNGLLQLFGVGKLATGAGILANPRAKEWVGLRAGGGDAFDLAVLGVALSRSLHPGRALGAMAFVLGAAALDLVGSEPTTARRSS